MTTSRRNFFKLAIPSTLLAMFFSGRAMSGSISGKNSNINSANQPVRGDDAMMTASQLIRVFLKSSPNKLVTIIGDSISHGANAGGPLYIHSWVNIFKRCFNNEFKSYSYGYAPTLNISNWREIHEVSFLPTNTTWVVKEGADAADIQQGISFTSKTVGASQKIKVPTFQGRCLIHYVKRPDGATVSISVNGSIVQNVTTNGPYDVTPIFVVPMTDSKGQCSIEITNTNGGTLEIIGYSFISNSTDEIKLMNYSSSGRRLANMSTIAMDSVFNEAAIVIMALGCNDSYDVNSDPEYANTFKTKIDYLISQSLSKRVPVVVPDFCWDSDPDSEVRKQLKRLATETSGLYIPFPDFLNIGNGITDEDFRVNKIKLFVDKSHPNQNGHKLIAETIAKVMQLSVTSKEQALSNNDWWFPLQLLNTGVDNKSTTFDKISAVKREGDHLVLRYSLKGIGGNTARDVQSEWMLKSGITTKKMNIVPISYKTDGTPNGTLSIDANGKITAYPNSINQSTEHDNLTIIF